jgi:hypothetical protein
VIEALAAERRERTRHDQQRDQQQRNQGVAIAEDDASERGEQRRRPRAAHVCRRRTGAHRTARMPQKLYHLKKISGCANPAARSISRLSSSR